MISKLVPYFLLIILEGSLYANSALEKSEQFAVKSGTTLHLLGDYLCGNLGGEKLTTHIDEDWVIQAGGVFEGGGRRIAGGFTLQRKKVIANPAPIALEAWRASYGENILRCKFKVVRVIPDVESSDLFQTEQLLELVARRDGGTAEIHQTWRASWRLVNDEAILLGMREINRDQAFMRGTVPAFTEKTAHILRLEKSVEGSLTRGANYWMARLEVVLKPDFMAETGISVADVNNDGRDDLYYCQVGGIPNQLFLQQEDGSYVNGAKSAGLDLLDNTTCALFVDFDNDGDQDVAITTAAGLAIMQNDSKGKFTRMQLFSGIIHGFGLCAADYDSDGLNDLYVCQYFASKEEADGKIVRGNFPSPYPMFDANNGGQNYLLKNTGKLTFRDATVESGADKLNRRFSFAAMWEDWDNDGDQDLYVANDFGKNCYYRNDQGRLVEASKVVGLDTGSFSMGITSADYNADGWMDMHISNMFSSAGNRITHQPTFMKQHSAETKQKLQILARGNTLLVNRGGKLFNDVSVSSGITVGRWSWASLSPDINNDGAPDLLVTNGMLTGKNPDDL